MFLKVIVGENSKLFEEKVNEFFEKLPEEEVVTNASFKVDNGYYIAFLLCEKEKKSGGWKKRK